MSNRVENLRNPYLINKAFNSMLFATILATASSNLAVVIDGIIVGQLLGAEALSAINLTMPLMQFIFTIVMLVSVGSSMLCAMAIGKGDHSKGESLFSFACGACAAIGVIISILGSIYKTNVAELLCANEQLLPLVERYTSIILLSAPIYFLLPTLCSFLRIDGAVRLTAIAMVVANVVNICFDVILINGFGMDIQGSSIATTIGNTTGIALLLSHFATKKSLFKLVIPSLKLSDIKQVISLGLPTALASALVTVKLATVNGVILEATGTSGASYLAVSMSLLMIVSMVVGGVVQSLQPIGSLLLGEGDKRGLGLLVNRAIQFVFIAVTAVVVAIEIFPTEIAALFGLKNSGDFHDAAVAIRLVTLSFLPFAITYLLMVVYQLSKRSKLSISISIAQPMSLIVTIYIIYAIAPGAVWYSFLAAELVVLISIFIITSFIKAKSKGLTSVTLIDMAGESRGCDLSIDSSDESSLATALHKIDHVMEDNQVSIKNHNAVRLVAEEIIGNIIKHGYKGGKKHFIDLRIVINDESTNLRIKDDGTPFNPLTQSNLDSGLGLKIVQGIAPNLEYKYILNQNSVFLNIPR